MPQPSLAGQALRARQVMLRGFGIIRGLGDDSGDDDLTYDYSEIDAPLIEPDYLSSDVELMPTTTYVTGAPATVDTSSDYSEISTPLSLPAATLQPNAPNTTASSISSVGAAAAALTKAITTPAGLTVYPAPAGTTLPAGAIGVNAQGQPINSLGQVISSSILNQATLGINNETLLIGAALVGGLALFMGVKK